MQFSALGPVTVTDGDGHALALGGWKQRAVLALLLHVPNHTVSVDRLITDIWGEEASDGARDALYTYVSNLRGVLGKKKVVRGPTGYRLVVEPDELEAGGFEADLGRAERLLGSTPVATARILEATLDRWRGGAYEGHEDLPSIAPEAARLDELRIAAQELRFEAMLRAGETPEPAEITVLCNSHPLREQPWALLMRAEYRAGRQADALRTFQRFKQQLGEDLGIEPSPALARLEEQILLQDPALDASRTTPTNLPIPVTSFVGRLEEQAVLDQAIHDHRLVTVLGPGGAGKTRLAIETARALLGSFPDGVWLVDLAKVPDPGAVRGAVVAALGVASDDALLEWLSARTALVILDNCEHVVEVAGQLAIEILERAPDLKVLATSRVALNRSGENRLGLLGLRADEEHADALELFLDRAEAVGGSTDPDAAYTVQAICSRLEGLPLAIELAASRTDVLSLDEINSYLSESLDLLAIDHATRDDHRSLDATVHWSVSLLDAGSQARFRSLGVFEGPFTAQAAGSVFDGMEPLAVVAELKTLSDASLVVARPAETGDTTYRLLEPIRAYARSTLIESGKWDDVATLHDDHYLEQCRSHREDMFGTGRVKAARRVELEIADYLAAWDRLEALGAESAFPFVWNLGHHWLSASVGPGYARMASVIESNGDHGSVEFADAMTIASWVGMYTNDWERAMAWADRAIGIYEEAGDHLGLAYAHVRRGHWAFGRGDIPTAMESLPLSLEICERIGYHEGKAWPMVLIGQARRWADDDSEEVRLMVLDAKETFAATGDASGLVHAGMVLSTFHNQPLAERLEVAAEMVEVAERHGGDNLLRPTAYHSLAYAIWDDGQRERAKGLNRACVRSALASGNLISLGLGLMQGARFAGLDGDAQRCALLNGAGRANFAFEVAPFQLRYEADAVAAANEVLSERGYDHLFDEGGRLSPEEAAALVLGWID